MHDARDPPTAQVRLDMAIWMAVFGTPWMIAAWLLWRAWWRETGARLSTLDGPGWLLAAAAAALVTGVALPAGRVFVPGFVGWLGGLATLAVARSRPLGRAGRGFGVAGLALVGIAGCIGVTIWYLAEYLDPLGATRPPPRRPSRR